MTINFGKNAITFANDAVFDSFGRLRVANPDTIFGSKQIFDNLPLFYDDQEVSGAGTSSTFSKDNARSRMAVSDTTAGKRVRQSFMRLNYQEGKSQEIILTEVMSGAGTGIIHSVGLSDDDNGLFFSNIDGVMHVVVRSSTSGSAVDIAVPQSEWSIDVMDGSGPSGVTLDFTKAQQMVFDFEWLGVGPVRFGFRVGGTLQYVHEEDNANLLGSVYMSTPNLPIRYSIENDGTGGVATLDHLCSAVISEGGTQHTGSLNGVDTGNTLIDMDTENQLYAILGVELKSTHFGASVEIVKTNVVLLSASDDIEWFLLFNPTVAGSPSFTAKASSAIEFYVGDGTNTITAGSGQSMDSGFASTSAGAGASAPIVAFPENLRKLGSAIDGTQDTIVLCARPINGSATDVIVKGSIIWRELS